MKTNIPILILVTVLMAGAFFFFLNREESYQGYYDRQALFTDIEGMNTFMFFVVEDDADPAAYYEFSRGYTCMRSNFSNEMYYYPSSQWQNIKLIKNVEQAKQYVKHNKSLFKMTGLGPIQRFETPDEIIKFETKGVYYNDSLEIRFISYPKYSDLGDIKCYAIQMQTSLGPDVKIYFTDNEFHIDKFTSLELLEKQLKNMIYFNPYDGILEYYMEGELKIF